MAINIRFQGIIGTLAQIAADKFAGRVAWATDIARMIWYYDSANYGEMARRDVLETFAQGINDSTGTSGRVVRYGASGRLQGDAGLTTTQTGGVTTEQGIGDRSAVATVTLNLNAAANATALIRWYDGALPRWQLSKVGADKSFLLRALDAAGTVIDDPILIGNAAGGTITLGGAAATKRNVNLTRDLQLSGTTRISSTGAATMASLQAANLTGSGSRPLATDASGNVYDQDVATFRTTIGLPSTVTREMVIQPLPITNSAPGVVTVGPSGSMRSFGFDGVTQVEELFYHIDIQHDYVAGTDVIAHIHWMPSTTGAGNVVWQWDYQWVEANGTFPAPTNAVCPAVAAGGTAWVDKRSEVTISGTGKTYNSRLLLRLFRDPANAGDTYGADAVISSIGVHYTANPLQAG